MDSIRKEMTITVTQVKKYNYGISINSYDSRYVFYRFPYYKHDIDKLMIIEAGNIYKMIYDGHNIYEIELVGEWVSK
jgi:hypothetical protein